MGHSAQPPQLFKGEEPSGQIGSRSSQVGNPGDFYRLVLQPHKICLNIGWYNGCIPSWNAKSKVI